MLKYFGRKEDKKAANATVYHKTVVYIKISVGTEYFIFIFIYIYIYFILSSLGSSQFRFQYQSFRFHLILNRNGPEMEPNRYKNDRNANSPLKTLYRKPYIQQ